MTSTTQPEWNASDYAQHSRGQFTWALTLIERLRLQPDEAVLDIGCGDGKISMELAKRVPTGRVFGIDNSPNMINLAQQTWCAAVPNIEFHVADTQRLSLAETFDAAFSNSTLHWVPDHRAVLKGVAAALRPGGRLLFSMGGRGTAAVVYSALEELRHRKQWVEFLADAQSPHYFYSIEEYEEWLPLAGFTPSKVALVPKPMQHAGPGALEGWIRTTWVPYTSRIPEDRRAEFVSELTTLVLAGCVRNDDDVVLLPMVNLEVEARKK